MVFLCGRPGCGRESSATLQIDAPASTISLVDPRVSRDGVPLCPHHADATTPPVGWTMNDLRSGNRTLTPVPSMGPRTGEIVSTPPRERPTGNPLFQSSRPSAEEEADAVEHARRTQAEHDADPDGDPDELAEDDPLTFKVSRELRSMPVAVVPAGRSDGDDGGDRPAGGGGAEPALTGRADGRRRRAGEKAPVSRPTKRREVAEAEEAEDDKFPWHFQFHDDEPQELQAKSPLLSRAFRSSVG